MTRLQQAMLLKELRYYIMKSSKAVSNKHSARPLNYTVQKIDCLQELDYGRGGIYINLLVLSVWTPYYISAIILTGLATYVLISPERRKFIFNGGPFGSFVWGIPIMSLLSSIINRNLLGVGISAGIFIIFIAGLYTYAIMSRTRFEKSCDLMCIGSVLAAVFAMIQAFAIYGHKSTYRPAAFAFHPNYYGMLAVFAILIALSKMRNCVSKRRYIFTVLMNICAILLCESRSALAGCAACIFAYLIIERKFKVAGIVSILGIGALMMCWADSGSFFWRNSLEFVVDQRADIWKGALKVYVTDPLTIAIGKGPMAYYAEWKNVAGPAADHAHSIYIDSLLNFGIFGTALIGAMVWKMAKGCSLKNTFGYAYNVRLLNMLMLIEIAASGIADNTIFWVHTAVFFVFVNSGMTTTGYSFKRNTESKIIQ